MIASESIQIENNSTRNWLVMVAVGVGSLLGSLDSSVVNIALPTIRRLFGTEARNIDREQGARLAAILPAPLKRRPGRMNHYSAIVLERMRQMGW